MPLGGASWSVGIWGLNSDGKRRICTSLTIPEHWVIGAILQILTETGAARGELLTAIQQAKRVPANNDIPVMRFISAFFLGSGLL